MAPSPVADHLDQIPETLLEERLDDRVVADRAPPGHAGSSRMAGDLAQRDVRAALGDEPASSVEDAFAQSVTPGGAKMIRFFPNSIR
jgi:hypothetical protein